MIQIHQEKTEIKYLSQSQVNYYAAKTYRHLTLSLAKALKFYKDWGWPINDYLRGGNTYQGYKKNFSKGEMIAAIQKVDKAFTLAPSFSYPILLYRGVGTIANISQIGESFHEKAYFSCAYSMEEADVFARANQGLKGYGSYLIKVIIPPGNNLIFLDSFKTVNTYQAEILVERSSIFRVIKVEKGNYDKMITIEKE